MLSNTYKIKPWQLLNMTILAILTGDGLTKEMYENVWEEVNWEGNPPPGVIFHAMLFDDSGKFCVAEVWESEEQWNNFFSVVWNLLCRKPMYPLQRRKYCKSTK
jgi:hypothetical protein